jgi:hypothetical protein
VPIQRCIQHFLFAWSAILLLSTAVVAKAQPNDDLNPCTAHSDTFTALPQAGDPADPAFQFVQTSGLYSTRDDLIVFDANQGLCWLADANLAADPQMQAALGVSGIDPNGAMLYATAVQWVAALNAYNNGKGYLGHNNWQLPVTPLIDTSCADLGSGGGNFGPLCTKSAMGNLYAIGLNQTFPASVAPHFNADIFPFRHFKLSYYWALKNNGGAGGGAGGGGQEMYAFSNSIQGGTTTIDSYYYVLPMVKGPIGTPPDCSTPGAPVVLPYTSGPAAGDAVYDCKTGYTWLADVDLARSLKFGLTGEIQINYTKPPRTLTVPAISHGSMLYSTAGEWIQGMNDAQFLGSSYWQMPDCWDDFKQLVADMNLVPGDTRLMQRGFFGPFYNLQPFFYWSCPEPDPGTIQSPCVPNGYAPPDGTTPLQFSYNFDYGFQSTSGLSQKYFVMVYYPAPALRP